MGIIEDIESSMKNTNFSQGITPPGLTPLNWGIDRMVFRIDVGNYRGKIMKIARKKRTIDQNRKEVRTWKNACRRNVDEYFCPIILEASDLKSYEYIVMEPAQTPVTSNEERETLVEKLKQKNIPVTDGSHGNFGYNRNGRVIFIDYPWGEF